MRLQRQQMVALLPCALVIIGGLTAVAAAGGLEDENNEEIAAAETSPHTSPDEGAELLPALFDFDHYKQVYDKRYNSLGEELNRKRLYLSRALGAFVTGAKYWFYQSSHYNAVNELSDWSEFELRAMRNQALAKSLLKSAGGGGAPARFPSSWPRPPETEAVQSSSRRGRKAYAAPPSLQPLQPLQPRSRPPAPFELAGPELLTSEIEFELAELVAKAERGADGGAKNKKDGDSQPANLFKMPALRELPLEKLINRGEREARRKSPAAAAVAQRVESNNPLYEPLELPSFGLNDQQEAVEVVDLRGIGEPSELDGASIWQQLGKLLRLPFGGGGGGQDSKSAEKPQNEVFADLRDTNCLSVARNQGKCGSCYAFATVAMMEWQYCRRTGGQLIEFSEQYLLDCGKNRFPAPLVMDGCQGGDIQAAARFVHNFGMELRSSYPYTGRAGYGMCPYAQDYDLKRTGYIRMEIGQMARLHMDHWAEFLQELGPLYVVVQTGPTNKLAEYGGGVDQCAYCRQGAGYHAMLVVGHGREDRRDYWLLRNSFGANWGEQGHWKLSKKAAEKYIHARQAYVFGTNVGRPSRDAFEPRRTIAAGAPFT